MIGRLALVLLSFALCWAVPEILVRIAHPPLQQYRDIPFGRDPNSRRAVELYLDGCHPTPAGHRLIADALFEQIPAAK